MEAFTFIPKQSKAKYPEIRRDPLSYNITLIVFWGSCLMIAITTIFQPQNMEIVLSFDDSCVMEMLLSSKANECFNEARVS